MDCPKCRIELARDQYENAPVYLCTSCSGYLIKRNRLLLIKQSRERSADVLKQEAAAESDTDTVERLRCPRCRVEKMRKERIRIEPEGEFQLDVCKKCDYIWFDGGELARWQLDHEAGASAQEAERFRQRVESRSEAEQAALNKRIADAPRESSLFAGAFFEVILIGVLVASFLLAIGALFVDAIFWSGLGSLAFCLSLGCLLPRVLHTRNALLGSIAVLVIAELVFLGYLIFA